MPGALTAWGWPKPPEGFTGWGWPETPEDFTDWGWPTMPGDFTGWSWPGLPADFTDWVWPTVPSQSAQAIVAALTGGEHSVAGTASAIDASIHFTQGLLRLKLDDMWRGLAGDIGGIKLTCPAPVINVAPPVVNYSPPPASSAPKDQTVTFKVTDQGGHELSQDGDEERSRRPVRIGYLMADRFIRESSGGFIRREGFGYLLREPLRSKGHKLAPAAIRQLPMRGELRPVDFGGVASPDGSITTAVATRGGLQVSLRPRAETAVTPGLRSGGVDVTSLLKPGSLKISRKLGEPWECEYTLLVDTSDLTPPEFETEDGQVVTTEAGVAIQLEGKPLMVPGLLELVRVSSPTETYRDTVLALNPTVYWPLDERDREEVDDYSESGMNRGVIDCTLVKHRVDPAVPYGGAMTFISGDGTPCVEGPLLPSASDFSVMMWLRKTTDTGTQRAVEVGGVTVEVVGGRVRAGGLTADLADGWRHVALTSSGALYVDGAAAATGAPRTLSAGRLRVGLAASPGISIDELSIHPSALTAAEVAACYAARNGERDFQGIVRRVSNMGWAAADTLQIDVEAVGLEIMLTTARASADFSTDGSETLREVVQKMLDDELPMQPITADGIDIPELVVPQQENYKTVHAAVTRLAELADVFWFLHPMGELIGYRNSEAPLMDLVLDEEVNLSSEIRPQTVDARLFRTQELVASEGGRDERETFVADGSTRFWVLPYDAQFDQGVSISVDGVPQSVDTAGRYDFDAQWAADGPTNAVLVPSTRPTPAKDSVIVVRYRSRRTQVVSIADIDAIRSFGLHTNVVFDNSVNTYRRREALAVALLAGNATPTRRVAVKGRVGAFKPPLPGFAYTLKAPRAYGVDGGAPWLCDSVEIETDTRQRAICTIGLQQGPYRPFSADFWRRLQEENLPAPE